MYIYTVSEESLTKNIFIWGISHGYRWETEIKIFLDLHLNIMFIFKLSYILMFRTFEYIVPYS